MLQTWRRSSRLFSDFNNFRFAGVLGMVLFVVLLLFMTESSAHHYGYGSSVDLPKVSHPVSMSSANREDAMTVNVTRDGKIYFDTKQVRPADLPQKIADRLRDRSVERKVYIKADMRARWGAVKLALDAVRAAGILRVAFLVYQRQSGAVHV